jgi:uncharacterized protein (TIGR03437 family)
VSSCDSVAVELEYVGKNFVKSIRLYLQLTVNCKSRGRNGILALMALIPFSSFASFASYMGLFATFLGVAGAQVDVPTANYDTNRTNANLSEEILNTLDVNATQFGKLYAFPVDGQVYAQPLYLHAFNMPGKGTLNVLYVATMHNSVYAFDADAASGTAPLWQVNLGESVNPLTIVDSAGAVYSDIQHEIGILSTPAIDRSGSTIYVVSETLQSGNMAFYLHALDLTTGSEKQNGPVGIQATVTGNGWSGTTDPNTGQLPFYPAEHIQRPGLLVADGAVYVGFGSHGDFVPWHGWIMAYNALDIQQQTAVFCTTPSGSGVAVWQGGRGLAADPNGEVYFSTGNGSYDGATNWGESVLHLTPALEVADWFTPAQYPDWTDDDADFGSSGPILVPGTNLLIAGGKAGLVALTDRTNMGHELGGNTQALETFQAVPAGQFAIYNAALWNRPDGPLLYIWGYEDALRAFQMQNGVFNTTAVAVNSLIQQNYAFGGMAVSSNGFAAGSGILWVTAETGGSFPTPGILHALDATDVSHELWNSAMNSARDTLGNFTKFANPTVASGKVYVPTDSQQIVVYGVLPVPGITAVVNAASFSSLTAAPGELITIFGNGIGPSTAQQLTIDAEGKVATSLGGVTVSFDGIAAPLLYAAAGQINAVVPFAVGANSSTLIEVEAPGGRTFTVSLPVSAAAPAVFTTTASGSGQGAILNSDMSVNSAAHPAARGSAISIYATGTGALSPAVADGTVIAAGSLPMSQAAVSVTIGGQAATVTYQGAAPGLVAGVMQINVQIPAGVASGAAVPVIVSVGGAAGLNTVTMAIQ